MDIEQPDDDFNVVWNTIRAEVMVAAREEPLLAGFFHATVLGHASLEAALSFHLANKLDSVAVPALLLRETIEEAFFSEPQMRADMRRDIIAVVDRDPACETFFTPLLFFKGFQALQAYRVANWLWRHGRRTLAAYLQNQISTVFSIDIHPAARIGSGVLLDHATGLVVGETTVIDDDVSILQGVTLGGTGKESGDRHPKIRTGVLIGAGAKILGNVVVGEGSRVGAGSVVLREVPPHVTVAGVPARIVGRPSSERPALDMNQVSGDGSHI